MFTFAMPFDNSIHADDVTALSSHLIHSKHRARFVCSLNVHSILSSTA